jgi:apolipoprotein N-acyltransferase
MGFLHPLGWRFGIGDPHRMAQTVSTGLPLLLSALAGSALGFVSNHSNWWPLALAALWIWFRSIDRAQRGGQGHWPLVLGLCAWSVAGMGWVVLAVQTETPFRPAWQAACLGLVALHDVACALPAWYVLRRCGPTHLRQAGACAWWASGAVLGAESLKQWGWLGHGYSSLGSTLVDLPLAPLVLPYVGALGMSALVLAGTAFLVARHDAASPSGRARPLWQAGLGLLAALTVSLWAERQDTAAAEASLPMVNVTALHSHLDKREPWDGPHLDAAMAELRDAIAHTAAGGVVITPETYIAQPPPQHATGAWLELLEQLKARQITALVGMPFRMPTLRQDASTRQDGTGLINAVVQVTPDRMSVYGKERLVPFGEYVPWDGPVANWYQQLFASAGSAQQPAPAAMSSALFVAGSAVGVGICHELSLASTMAARAREATWLLVVSEDGWLPSASYRRHMLGLARLRAMETGLPLLRVANAGDTALISSAGQILAWRGAPDPRAHMTLRVQPRAQGSFYARWSAWCTLGTYAFMAWCVLVHTRQPARALSPSLSSGTRA